MDLIFWRHAEAEPGAVDLDDLDRKLTDKGERQARRMAKWLGDALPSNTRILCSPALRTQQTARALDRPFEIEPAIGTDAGPTDLLRAAGWPHARQPVLLVGHQPTLGEAAAQVMSGRPHGWAIRKGAVWWFRHTGDGVLLVTVRSPDDV
jgi:phosphohistidine phosphatase